MSQYAFSGNTIINQSFPDTRTALNAAYAALASNSSGDNDPTSVAGGSLATVQHQWWYDSTNNKLMLRNDANNAWIEIATIDETSGNVLSITTQGLTIGATALTATGTEINQLSAITRGSILYGNASGATSRLAAGGVDTVLTSDGTDISWAAASSGGGYRTLISTTTISDGDATVLITGFSSTYTEYQFVIEDFLFNDSDGYPLRMRVQANSAIDSTSGNYRFSVIYGNSSGTGVSNGRSGTASDHIDLNIVMDSASPDTSYLVFNLINPSDTTNSVRGYGRHVSMLNGVLYQGPMAFAYVPVTYAVTGLQFYNPGSSGTLKSGTIKLYGIS